MKNNLVNKALLLVAICFFTAFVGCLEAASSTVSEVTGGAPASSADASEDSAISESGTEVGTYVGNGSGVPSDTNVGTYVGNGSGVPSDTNVGTYVGNGSSPVKNLISFVTVAETTGLTDLPLYNTSTTTESASTASLSYEGQTTTALPPSSGDSNTLITDGIPNPVTSTELSPTLDSFKSTLNATGLAPKPGKKFPRTKVAKMVLSASPDEEPWPYDYCLPKDSNSIPGAETQTCFVTPNHYNLGILKISLAKCLSDGIEVPCAYKAYDSSETLTLYDGEQVNMAIGDVSNFFNQNLNDIGTDFTAGGLRIETTYFEQQFPETGEEAEKIAVYLRGKNYRICTTPTADAATMLIRCGNANAQQGDLLIDMNMDGLFGFMDLVDATETNMNELDTRPEIYKLGSTLYYQNALERLTEATIDLGGLYEFGAGKHYQISVAYNVANTLLFTDGSVAGSGGVMGLVCVSALASHNCEAGDADPFSVGIYNPYYDNGLAPILPSPAVTVQMLTEPEPVE